MIDLTGRKVLITGASRGIGAACARLFSQAGAQVWIHYRHNDHAARKVLSALREVPDGPHQSSAADLAETAGVVDLFARLERVWGALDCLVNNAGIWVHNPLAELSPERLAETWRVNVTAPFLCAWQALPLLRSSVDGSIINVSSTAGQRGEAFYSPYAASKGALISATKSWSSELAPTVRVNAVAPGWVDTDMCIEPFAEGGRERIEATIPLGRVAAPEDIAGAALFLASPLARHVTGEILNVNGGSVLVG